MVPFLPFFAGTLFGFVLSAPIEYYATKYDHVDVEMILNNRRMVNHYAACLLSKGPCPPEGIEFKRILPEALRTNCERCTEKQKTVAYRAIKRLKKEYPKVWVQLEEQWDPQNIYVKKFEETFNTRQVETLPEASVQIVNKFGEADDENSITVTPLPPRPSSTTRSVTNIQKISTTKVPNSTSRTTSTTVFVTEKTESSTKKISTINAIPISAIKSPTTKFTTTTNKPIITTLFTPIRLPSVPNIGAGIQATVSFGTNLVGEFVRGLGAIGTRVVETGAEIADVVFKNIARPL